MELICVAFTRIPCCSLKMSNMDFALSFNLDFVFRYVARPYSPENIKRVAHRLQPTHIRNGAHYSSPLSTKNWQIFALSKAKHTRHHRMICLSRKAVSEYSLQSKDNSTYTTENELNRHDWMTNRWQRPPWQERPSWQPCIQARRKWRSRRRCWCTNWPTKWWANRCTHNAGIARISQHSYSDNAFPHPQRTAGWTA